jgi:NAD+ synthase (glutamine-hydrolysing)
MFLPNYGVFDEKRYFSPGTEPLNFVMKGITMGLGVCEDIWVDKGPARLQARCGASVIVNINASPYHMEKAAEREDMLRGRAMENGVHIVYNNMVGGQDELVFDGRGLVMGPDGRVAARARAFEEDLLVHDLMVEPRPPEKACSARLVSEALTLVDLGDNEEAGPLPPLGPCPERRLPEPSSCEEVYRALVLGTTDYTRKNGFGHAVIALSGGIDSALVAVIAEEALGRENITCVFMPSRYTSKESTEDARALVHNLGVELLTIPIDDIFDIYLKALSPFFRGLAEDVTEENIQARIRGDLIMALSNKFGWLVLTTGNKSEMSVGYATLYGDMAGGFAVIKDVPKTLVYKVSKWLNEVRGDDAPIPGGIIAKPPSAELRAGQRDQDTLPPYEDLDSILKAYVEEDRSKSSIVEMGFPEDLVTRVIEMVDRSEYKRRQAPPGIKITPRAFGRDRRMPITNRYRAGR